MTRTTLSVPSLTGAVMCMGVATANSILMVSFARDRMDAGVPALQAAIEAGYTRMRPVLMTALAMIIGMLPMALGFGEGGEQNAPLGRAVIGGLLFATVATLFFVPSVFAIIHGRRQARNRGQATIECGEGRSMSVEQPPEIEHQSGMQNQSRPAHAEIERPPELPPAPTGRAKMLVGIVLILLLVAGLITFLMRRSESERFGEGNRSCRDSNSGRGAACKPKRR